MTDTTPRMAFPYPGRDDEPWYDKFEDFAEALDASGYAAREDRSLIFGGGGTVSWDAGTGILSWSGVINVSSPIGGRLLQVAAGSLTLTDGDVMYITLVRYPLQNTPVPAAKAAQIPADDNNIAFAVRMGTSIYFRTGLRLGSGESSSGVTPSANDPNAIHTNVAGEIAGIALKATPATTDLVVLEDSAAGNAKKRATVGSLPATDPNALHKNVASEISALALKAVPTELDYLVIEDAADGNAKKRVTIGTLPGASAGSYISLGPYSYTQALIPVEEIIGDFTFDGDLVGAMTAYFRCVMRPEFSMAGWAEVRLYDLGPAGGPFGVPRLVATLQRVAGGIMDVEQALTVVSVGPVTNQIWDTKRVYEVVVIQNSTAGDKVFVGSASLEVVA